MRSSLGEARNVGFVEEDTLHTPILRYELGNATLLQMLTPIRTGTDRIGVWSQHQVDQSQPCSHEATVVAAGSLEWSHRATDAVGRVTCPPAAARNDFWAARNGIDNFETGNMFPTAAQTRASVSCLLGTPRHRLDLTFDWLRQACRRPLTRGFTRTRTCGLLRPPRNSGGTMRHTGRHTRALGREHGREADSGRRQLHTPARRHAKCDSGEA